VANAYPYRYYILAPRPGVTPADAARAAVSAPERYWTVTGRAATQADANDRVADDGIVVFAANRDMAVSRAKNRLCLQFAAQARALARADLDAGIPERDAVAVLQALGLPLWAVRPLLSAIIGGAYRATLHGHATAEHHEGAGPP
jgi:hypothetical protein